MKQIRTFFLGENLVMFDLQDVVKVEVNDTLATFTLNNGESLNTDKFDFSLLNTIKTVYLSLHSTYVNVKSIVGYSDAELVDVLGNKYVITEDESKQIADIVADAETISVLNYTFIKENVITLNGTQKKVNGVSIDLHKPGPAPAGPNYLTITALEDGTTVRHYLKNYFYEYSIDNGESWNEWNAPFQYSDCSEEIFLQNAGDKILIRGNGLSQLNGRHFEVYKNYTVSGSVMSLIDGDGTTDIIPEGTNFSYLFSSEYTLISAENLVLPATKLTNGCYMRMFDSCQNLIKGPKVLPAKDIPLEAYYQMFRRTKLKEAPEIKAENITERSVKGMFQGCKSLSNVTFNINDFGPYVYGQGYTWCAEVLHDYIYTEEGVTQGTVRIKNNAVIRPNDYGVTVFPSCWTIERF